jgi:hypothetical protein
VSVIYRWPIKAEFTLGARNYEWRGGEEATLRATEYSRIPGAAVIRSPAKRAREEKEAWSQLASVFHVADRVVRYGLTDVSCDGSPLIPDDLPEMTCTMLREPLYV